ncbi:hypothetical protein FOZ61_009669 [Perkinsus olseni]|uniref:Uncharacterized protein n=1 Tax=Perkinsus olseni TaxID=32597 RepID=A0A7J6KYP1_PEROL|nr:hypothetical protein FOZ61_009669 [Perkinsus olseni]KAF4655247.1 hypothetical protein FOL46_008318 [Perkinsus olseni]
MVLNISRGLLLVSLLYPAYADDVPPEGVYLATSVPRGLGDIRSVCISVNYTLDGPGVAGIALLDKSTGPRTFRYGFFQLARRMLSPPLSRRHGIIKCFYFSRAFIEEISAYLALKTGTQRDTGVKVLLCWRKVHTESKPTLTLFMSAVRGPSNKYIDLGLPVHFTFAGHFVQPSTSRKTEGGVDQPPNKRLETVPTRAIRNGHYSHPLTSVDVELGDDGRQHVLLISTNDELELVLSGDALLVPAEDYSSTGCFKLEGGSLPDVCLCPVEGGKLVVRGVEDDKTLTLDSSVK